MPASEILPDIFNFPPKIEKPFKPSTKNLNQILAISCIFLTFLFIVLFILLIKSRFNYTTNAKTDFIIEINDLTYIDDVGAFKFLGIKDISFIENRRIYKRKILKILVVNMSDTIVFDWFGFDNISQIEDEHGNYFFYQPIPEYALNNADFFNNPSFRVFPQESAPTGLPFSEIPDTSKKLTLKVKYKNKNYLFKFNNESSIH